MDNLILFDFLYNNIWIEIHWKRYITPFLQYFEMLRSLMIVKKRFILAWRLEYERVQCHENYERSTMGGLVALGRRGLPRGGGGDMARQRPRRLLLTHKGMAWRRVIVPCFQRIRHATPKRWAFTGRGERDRRLDEPRGLKRVKAERKIVMGDGGEYGGEIE